MKKIAIINGPNLNLVGVRERAVYGSESLTDYLQGLCARFPDAAISLYQSNVEGELVNLIQQVGFEVDGMVINPGGYSHTSVAIHDALRAVEAKAVEVHISNIHAREEFRQRSLTGAACVGVISGLGLKGYDMAVEWLLKGGAACK